MRKQVVFITDQHRIDCLKRHLEIASASPHDKTEVIELLTRRIERLQRASNKK